MLVKVGKRSVAANANSILNPVFYPRYLAGHRRFGSFCDGCSFSLRGDPVFQDYIHAFGVGQFIPELVRLRFYKRGAMSIRAIERLLVIASNLKESPWCGVHYPAFPASRGFENVLTRLECAVFGRILHVSFLWNL
jgi:hypothetical protein